MSRLSSSSSDATSAARSGPWWRYPHMWLVVGGPAVVVAACVVTIYLAVSRPDPVYVDAPSASAGQAAPASARQDAAALAPAMQARNHAATGGLAHSEAPKR